MKLNGRIVAVATISAAIIVGAFLPSYITKVRAQLDAPQTWAGSAGGSANALTLTVPNVASMADLLGVPIRFLPASSNAAGATTVNVNSIGPQTVKRVSGGGLVPIAGGDFTINVRAEIVWDGTQFTHSNPATGSAAVGSEISFTGAAANIPAGYLVENGTCISQTTYPALYASYGSTDLYLPGSTGGACSGGSFHLKFANGRASVAADTQGGQTASVLTSAGSGCAATGPAVFCGGQNQTLAQSALPNTTLSIPSGQGSHTHGPGSSNNFVNAITGNSYLAVGSGGSNPQNSTSSAATAAATLPAMATASINGGVTQTTVPTVQPTSTVIMLVKY